MQNNTESNGVGTARAWARGRRTGVQSFAERLLWGEERACRCRCLGGCRSNGDAVPMAAGVFDLDLPDADHLQRHDSDDDDVIEVDEVSERPLPRPAPPAHAPTWS